MTVFDHDLLVPQVLDRLVLIEKTIPSPIGDGRTLPATPYFWDFVTVNEPMFFNRWAGAELDKDDQQGRGLYRDTLRFLVRLDAGTLGSGTLHLREDDLNRLAYTVINRFRQSPLLEHPDTGEPLRYVLYPGAVLQRAPNGIAGVRLKQDADAPTYLITDFELSVTVQTKVGRLR